MTLYRMNKDGSILGITTDGGFEYIPSKKHIAKEGSEKTPHTSFCPNCMGENLKTGYVELWDNICPECGRKVSKNELVQKK